MRREVLTIILVVLSMMSWADFVLAQSTTIILPNGGECLTVGQAYNIQFSWSGSAVKHVALYFRTDGQQPTHLDTSLLQHPINTPQPGSPWRWTPNSSHITETGRVWVDGHNNNHDSLNTWDSSNANFAVRSNCAAVEVSPRPIFKVPQPPAGFENPAKAADIIPLLSSARIRFESPWQRGDYRVRLVEDQDGRLVTLATKDLVINPGDIIEFSEFKLRPNTFYKNKRYIYAYDFGSSNESVLSEVMRPFWTLTENPKKIEVAEIATSSAVLKLLDQVPNLGVGLTAIRFDEFNSLYSSGWTTDTSWKFIGLQPDTQYQFWVKFRNGGGIETPLGALVTFRTKPLPAAPIPEEFYTPQLKELEERVKKIGKVVAGYQELVKIREEEAREEVAVPELPPPPPPPKPEIPEKKAIIEEVRREPPRPSQKLVVTFDGKEFSPATLEIVEGDTVEWRNNSVELVWPAVDPITTHTGLLGFDSFGFLLAGEFYRFTFRRPGTWPYHDHVSEKEGRVISGSIVVEPKPIPVPEKPVIAEEKIPLPPTPARVVIRKAVKPVKPPVLSEELKELEKEIFAAPSLPTLPSLPPSPPPRPPKIFVVLFEEDKFNPQVLEINSGDTVRWINRTNRPVWPAVDPHPTHTGLPGFDALGDLLLGETYNYAFTKAGTVTYHNHTVARAGDVPEAGVILIKPR